MKYKKFMVVWKICKRSFKCDVAGSSSFIRLEMAPEWMKTLPYSILKFNCIRKVLKRSSSLWQAPTFKQIWDWSWMKDNSKIFENTLKKLYFFVSSWKNMHFFKVFAKIFEFFFIQDQSQICNSNRLEVRACQSELLLFKTF